MARRLVFNYPIYTNDSDRYQESTTYVSPENLLTNDRIYVNQDGNNLKSLHRYFCRSNTSIEYKNIFANDYMKDYLYRIKKQEWNAFLSTTQPEKIREINRLILLFIASANNSATLSFTIENNEDSYKLIISNIIPGVTNVFNNTIEFLKNNNFHLLTLYILLEINGNIQPLLLCKYEFETRNIIENIIVNHFDFIRNNIINNVFIIPNDFNLESLNRTNTGLYGGNLSVFDNGIGKPNVNYRLEKYLSLINTNNINDYMRILFNENFTSNNTANQLSTPFLTELEGNNFTYMYSYNLNGYLTFADIDQGIPSLKLGDLLYFSYIYRGQENIREKFIGSVAYGYLHELGHDLSISLK
jgi:hypothetical protein